jgi:hypothetical protein
MIPAIWSASKLIRIELLHWPLPLSGDARKKRLRLPRLARVTEQQCQRDLIRAGLAVWIRRAQSGEFGELLCFSD